MYLPLDSIELQQVLLKVKTTGSKLQTDIRPDHDLLAD